MAAEVPNEVLRGDVAMKDACVWQLDKRTTEHKRAHHKDDDIGIPDTCHFRRLVVCRTYVDVCSGSQLPILISATFAIGSVFDHWPGGQRDGHPTVLAEEAFTLSDCPHVSCAEAR